MDYKEKLEEAKRLYETANVDQKYVLESLFSELKESKDERIRKELIEFVKSRGGFKQEYISWLEKQAEQNTVVFIPKFRVGDVIRHKGSTAEYTIESISGECYHGKGWGLHISGEEDYELVGQKPAWSEEDKEHIESILKRLDGMCKKGATFTKTCFAVSQDMQWLKSLRPQKQWKPSDEQIGVIEAVINNRSFQRRHLDSLYEQLKKLKGD